ncbi:MAG TPA: M20 family peptidase [Longimicrobium sp.]|nr:M20 family peptidase [Longimicrobium sp.]
MKKLALALGAALVLLLAVMLVRTARFGDAQGPAPAAAAFTAPAGAAERLAEAIRIPTVSNQDSAQFDTAAFGAFHTLLRQRFPRVHARLRLETVGGYSLLYTWPGTDPSLPPVLLMGHMDVVPVEPGTEARWTRPPFSGALADGFVWGRGALDDKVSVMGTLEAVEMLLADNFAPRRTVMLAYGHDEETGGRGAKQIAALLRARGVRPLLVLDEGGIVGRGLMPGVERPTALVGIAEKGFVSVELAAEAPGGHSSMPPRTGSIGRLSAAIQRLEASPMPARLDGPTLQLFGRVGPEMGFAQRMVFANLWITRPLVIRTLEGAPSSNAIIRTTTAPTIFQAGTKENVLPSRARAVVNFRILPGDSVAGVVAHVRRVVGDTAVRVRVLETFSSEPSPVSRTDDAPFRLLERSIRQFAPDAVVAPYLVVGGTDARHFHAISEHVYRFMPVRVTQDDLARVHGTDERISIRDYEAAIGFYRQLLLNTSGS